MASNITSWIQNVNVVGFDPTGAGGTSWFQNVIMLSSGLAWNTDLVTENFNARGAVTSAQWFSAFVCPYGSIPGAYSVDIGGFSKVSDSTPVNVRVDLGVEGEADDSIIGSWPAGSGFFPFHIISGIGSVGGRLKLTLTILDMGVDFTDLAGEISFFVAINTYSISSAAGTS